ncbi:MAG TPA: biotin transporter BioY [Stackebrandtia sp.]|jgi:biotin transport system substrate-specific component|uniref:biotin transporter BioY n=1 Tax=Stackebrandtia sp. TaxID=2023065 RepID=UPI002D2CFCE4|nr:biotin transporter BioY [Stackebrandtia sp.]HZE41978.1 biotin transporter BioY [Stackebrandtia sp.]
MSVPSLPAPRGVLADLIPTIGAKAWARDAVLVAGGAALTGLSAQVAIEIPAISPVPFVLTTLTVLLLGACYGPARAAASMAVYLLAGLAGVPWFSEGYSGAVPTLGYVIGFLIAAPVVGALARRGGDRTVARTAGLMVVGNVIIYAAGVPYLMAATGMGLSDGLAKGLVPFAAGDLIKLVIAAALLPAAWKLVNRFTNA